MNNNDILNKIFHVNRDNKIHDCSSRKVYIKIIKLCEPFYINVLFSNSTIFRPNLTK